MIKRSLEDLYGNEPLVLAAQQARYREAQQRFVERFGPGPVTVFRTPGRLNLIGEHTDYNGGFVMPVALDKDLVFVTRPRDDPVVNAINVEAGFSSFAFALSDDVPHAPSGDWSNYFRGAGQEICRRFANALSIKGMDVLVSGAGPCSVPRGAGLSSSTALTVTTALALVVLNGIDIERADLAHLCSEAEWYVGTRGGMMDQFATLLGKRDHALFLDCRPLPGGTYRLKHVPIPGNVEVVLLNSGVHHDNVRGEFNRRVAECKIGVRLLQRYDSSVTQLRDVTPGQDRADFWSRMEAILPGEATVRELIDRGLDEAWLNALLVDYRLDRATTFAVLPRCRHVIGENERVQAGVDALRNGQVALFGQLMNRAHASMSQDYAASCLEVDALVEIVQDQPGVLGARITGAGWGGGVVALVSPEGDENWTERVRQIYRDRTGLETDIFGCRPGDGAGLVQEFD
ncbi:MAG: galactokinase [Anaerolineae bacterium]|nr:galactokinase [Anaerolineae bacterium]